MTSRCPNTKCLLRTRVRRLIPGEEETYEVACRVCGQKWHPYSSQGKKK